LGLVTASEPSGEAPVEIQRGMPHPPRSPLPARKVRDAFRDALVLSSSHVSSSIVFFRIGKGQSARHFLQLVILRRQLRHRIVSRSRRRVPIPKPSRLFRSFGESGMACIFTSARYPFDGVSPSYPFASLTDWSLLESRGPFPWLSAVKDEKRMGEEPWKTENFMLPPTATRRGRARGTPGESSPPSPAHCSSHAHHSASTHACHA
jgi:hypothetical protein